MATGNDVLKNALAIMGGDPGTVPGSVPPAQAAAAVLSINTMLADLFNVNNSILAANGLATLAAIPSVAALGDALPQRDELTRNVMHYGLARDLGLPRNHTNLAYFADAYESGKARYTQGAAESVVDVYGGCSVDDMQEAGT